MWKVCAPQKRLQLPSLVNMASNGYRRSVGKASVHFEYLEDRSRGLYVTWQPVRGDLTAHL